MAVCAKKSSIFFEEDDPLERKEDELLEEGRGICSVLSSVSARSGACVREASASGMPAVFAATRREGTGA